VTTEGGDYLCAEPSPIEELAITFEFCQSPDDFATVVEGCSGEVVEDAIALQSTQPRRRQLSEWLSLGQNQAAGAKADSLSQRAQGRFETYAQLLIEGIASGLDGVKNVLQPWSEYERWATILKAEELLPEAIEKLHQIEPNWSDLCVVW
jgi:hypothetical protein